LVFWKKRLKLETNSGGPKRVLLVDFGLGVGKENLFWQLLSGFWKPGMAFQLLGRIDFPGLDRGKELGWWKELAR